MARGGNDSPDSMLALDGCIADTQGMNQILTADELIQAAREYATQSHRESEGANSYGDQDNAVEYWTHLSDTEEVELRFGGTDPDVIAACSTHDVLEDCHLDRPMSERRSNLAAATSPRVDEISWGVTDRIEVPDEDNPGEMRPARNRKERKAATLGETAKDAGSRLVKVDDNIANVENGRRLYGSGRARGLVKMYVKEHPAFEQALFVPGEQDAKWQHLRAIKLISDAPAGEGDWVPSGRFGGSRLDARALNRLTRQCEKGEADELFMPAPGVMYARLGSIVFERGIHSNGKKSQHATDWTDVEVAKVQFARLLPAKVDRFYRPIEIDGKPLTVDELLAPDATAGLIQARSLINAGNVIGSHVRISDRDRDGIREGVRRWVRHNPEPAASNECAPLVDAILGGEPRPAWSRPARRT